MTAMIQQETQPDNPVFEQSQIMSSIARKQCQVSEIIELRKSYLADDLRNDDMMRIDEKLDEMSIHVGYYHDKRLVGAIRFSDPVSDFTYLNRLNFYQYAVNMPDRFLEVSRFFIVPGYRRYCVNLLFDTCDLMRKETQYGYYLALAQNHYTKIYRKLGTTVLYSGIKLRNKDSEYCISLGKF